MTKKIKNFAILIAIPVLLFAVCALLVPNMGINNIGTVLSQSLIPIAMGFGVAFAQADGLFDLSGGTRMLLSAVVGAVFVARFGLSSPGLVIGAITVGILAGAIMGIAQNILKIPSLILSLGFLMIFEVIAGELLGSSSFIKIPSEIAAIGKTPYNYIIVVVLGVIFYFIYYKTRISNHIKAAGENEILAGNMGINIKSANFWAYTIGGGFLGVAGILEICYSGSMASQIGLSSMSLIFRPMMGVMVGAVLLSLCNNLAITICIGEICITILYTAIIGMGVSSTMQKVVLGVFMVVVMAISNNQDVYRKFRTRIVAKKQA